MTEPPHLKTCFRAMRPGKAQTSLLNYRDMQESWNLGLNTYYYLGSGQLFTLSNIFQGSFDLHICVCFCSKVSIVAKKGPGILSQKKFPSAWATLTSDSLQPSRMRAITVSCVTWTASFRSPGSSLKCTTIRFLLRSELSRIHLLS